MQHLEEAEQIALMDWARLVRTEHGPLAAYLFAIPNGSHLAGDRNRRAMQMARLKRMGLLTGAADLLLSLPRPSLGGSTEYHGLYLELKKPQRHFQTRRAAERAVSQDQIAFGQNMLQVGYAWVVAYGYDEARPLIETYLRGELSCHEP